MKKILCMFLLIADINKVFKYEEDMTVLSVIFLWMKWKGRDSVSVCLCVCVWRGPRGRDQGF